MDTVASGDVPSEPRLRTAVTALPPRYTPGLGERQVCPTPYDLSANENPYPPLPGVLDAACTAAAHLNRYPDLTCATLFAELADRLSVPAGNLAFGTGSVGLAQQLLQATAARGDEVIYAWRSFEAYRTITRISGATPIEVPLREERHDLETMADAVTARTRLVFVCNPNNPTGTAVRRKELELFLDRVPRDVLIVLDEAYREFVRDPQIPDGVSLYRERPNVAVLRTFSKAYGLAGLRVGFAVAHNSVAGALRACAVPFGVSTPAQAAAVASLRAENALAVRVEELVLERTRLISKLRSAGWHPPETHANFVWLRLGERTGAFAEACKESGVAIKAFPGDGARVTVGERAANDLLLKVVSNFSAPA